MWVGVDGKSHGNVPPLCGVDSGGGGVGLWCKRSRLKNNAKPLRRVTNRCWHLLHQVHLRPDITGHMSSLSFPIHDFSFGLRRRCKRVPSAGPPRHTNRVFYFVHVLQTWNWFLAVFNENIFFQLIYNVYKLNMYIYMFCLF